MKPKHVLVTGGAGLIGSHVASSLLHRNYKVCVLDDLSGGTRNQVPDGAIFEQGSIVDTRFVNDLFHRYQFDYIFHFAAYAAEGLSHFIRRFNYDNNVIGSINLINAAVNFEVKKFVFTSSIAVYGNLPPPVCESMTPIPEDPYGIAKHAIEQELRIAFKHFGLKYVIIRPHNVYGEYQNLADPYRNVIGIFINQILHHEALTIFGDGMQQRAFTYVGDIRDAFVQALEDPRCENEIFNLGSDTPATINHVADIVSSAMGVKPQREYLPPRQEAVDCYADHTKSKKLLGDLPHTPLDIGIGKMVTWATRSNPRTPSWLASLEIEKNVPPIWLRNHT